MWLPLGILILQYWIPLVRKTWSWIGTGGHYGLYLFLPKTYIRIFYQEGIHHCAAHKYSTATVIKKCFQSQQQIWSLLYLDSIVLVCIEVDYQKQQTYCFRLHCLDFVIENLFVIPVVSISHWSSFSILFRIRIFSLFCLMVLHCSFYHLTFRKWPFSNAVGHNES